MIKASTLQILVDALLQLKIRCTYLPNVVLIAHPKPAGNTCN